MLTYLFTRHFIMVCLVTSLITGCYQPPYNNFKEFYNDSQIGLIRKLQQQGIQYIEYGDKKSLIIPTDRYYKFNSAQFNELRYSGLNNLMTLLKYYPDSTIVVGGFSDDIGSKIHQKKLSTARAETMLTYLWANDIKAQQLKAHGFGDKYDIAENALIHGSAQNRRIEIQW